MERKKRERKGKEREFFLTTLRGGFYDRAAFIPRRIILLFQAQARPPVQVQIHFGIGGVLAARGIYMALHGVACRLDQQADRQADVYTVLIIHHFHFFSCLISPPLFLSFHDNPTDGQTNRQANRQTGRRVHSAYNSPFLLLLSRHPYLSLHTHTPHSTPQPAHRPPHSAQRAPARPYSARP
jgi:hypothetical protein